VWDSAMASRWTADPVWLHGDVAAGNLLVRDGRLSAVIDFGGTAVGDPDCDLAIAWTLLSGRSRQTFRAGLRLDPGTWARGRGWALWKALITLVPPVRPIPPMLSFPPLRPFPATSSPRSWRTTDASTAPAEDHPGKAATAAGRTG